MATTPAIKTFEQILDPDDVLDYGFNWTEWLNGDTIVSSVWFTKAEDAITEGANGKTDSHDDTRTKAWFSTGEAGKSYMVTNRIVTLGGRTKDRSGIIICRTQ